MKRLSIILGLVATMLVAMSAQELTTSLQRRSPITNRGTGSTAVAIATEIATSTTDATSIKGYVDEHFVKLDRYPAGPTYVSYRLTDWQSAIDYRVVAYNTSAYTNTAAGLGLGQIMFNTATISSATEFNIRPALGSDEDVFGELVADGEVAIRATSGSQALVADIDAITSHTDAVGTWYEVDISNLTSSNIVPPRDVSVEFPGAWTAQVDALITAAGSGSSGGGPSGIPDAPANLAAAARYELNVPASSGDATWVTATAGGGSADTMLERIEIDSATATAIAFGIQGQGTIPSGTIRPSGALIGQTYYIDYRDAHGKQIVIGGNNTGNRNIQLADLNQIQPAGARVDGDVWSFEVVNYRTAGNVTFSGGGIADIRPTAAQGGAIVGPGQMGLVTISPHQSTRYHLQLGAFSPGVQLNDNANLITQTASGARTAGGSGTAARADHRHLAPANATTSAPGFMSQQDKTKLDGYPAQLPIFATVALEPPGVDGENFPDEIDVVFSDKLRSVTLTNVQLNLAGVFLTLSSDTPLSGIDTETQGHLRFELSDASKLSLQTNVDTSDDSITAQVTLSFSGGPHYHNMAFLVNNPAFGQGAGLTQAQVDARVTAGVLDWAETGNTDRIPAAKQPTTLRAHLGQNNLANTTATQSGVYNATTGTVAGTLNVPFGDNSYSTPVRIRFNPSMSRHSIPTGSTYNATTGELSLGPGVWQVSCTARMNPTGDTRANSYLRMSVAGVVEQEDNFYTRQQLLSADYTLSVSGIVVVPSGTTVAVQFDALGFGDDSGESAVIENAHAVAVRIGVL